VGHLVRCVALAEELQARGAEPVFLAGTGGLAWAQAQLDARGLARVEPAPDAAGLAGQAVGLGLDAVVTDAYDLDPVSGRALRAAGLAVLAFVDGAAGAQEADVVVDQNLGAEHRPPPPGATPAPGGQRLAGVRYAVLRDAVCRLRPPAPRAPAGPARDVLVVLGGTDASGTSRAVAGALLATGLPLRVRVLVRGDAAGEVAALPTGPGQVLSVGPPVDGFAELAVRADLVVSAAGTTVWELLCLGVPAALTWVADNQRDGYTATVAARAASGLGPAEALRRDPGPAVAALAALLGDPAARSRLAATGHALVDGEGRARVADALAATIGSTGAPGARGAPAPPSVPTSPESA